MQKRKKNYRKSKKKNLRKCKKKKNFFFPLNLYFK